MIKRIIFTLLITSIASISFVQADEGQDNVKETSGVITVTRYKFEAENIPKITITSDDETSDANAKADCLEKRERILKGLGRKHLVLEVTGPCALGSSNRTEYSTELFILKD